MVNFSFNTLSWVSHIGGIKKNAISQLGLTL
jgi:hypothetical protein